MKKKNRTIFKYAITTSILLALMPIRETHASYINAETTSGNSFSATTLDISLKDSSMDSISEELFDEEYVDLITSTEESFHIIKEGDLDFEYNVEATNFSNDPDLCSGLIVDMEVDGSLEYSGLLSNLDSEVETISGTVDEISLEIMVGNPDYSLQGKECEFDLEVTAWQIGGNSSVGFFDVEEIEDNSVESGYWAPPDVEVLVPNGGEVYSVGETVSVEWNATPSDPSASIVDIDIYLSKDGGATYPTTIVENITSSPHLWIIDKSAMVFGPGEDPETMKIKIIATDSNGFIGEDESDANFDPKEEEEDEDKDDKNKDNDKEEEQKKDEEESNDSEELEEPKPPKDEVTDPEDTEETTESEEGEEEDDTEEEESEEDEKEEKSEDKEEKDDEDSKELEEPEDEK